MKFTPLASSSKGNAYLLQADGVPPLLLEAGIPIKHLRAKLHEHGIVLSDLAACFVSHEHQDHAKAVKDLLKAGVDIGMSYGTAKVLDVNGHYRAHPIVAGRQMEIGPWTILSFHLEHDAEEPIGFFIGHRGERLLFIADTGYVKDRFSGITIAAIECNNLAEILSKNILEGHIPAIVGKRVRRNHMNLENLISMLKANDLSRCRAIYLMHLSDGNSNESRMIKEVQEATGIPTEAC
jgi:phosphoribosyl 1,2-cyclic phosphodiesterase